MNKKKILVAVITMTYGSIRNSLFHCAMILNTKKKMFYWNVEQALSGK